MSTLTASSLTTEVSSCTSGPQKPSDAVEQAWQDARKQISSKCSVEQQIIIASATSGEDLLNHLECVATRSEAPRLAHSLRRVRPFVDAISQYEHVLKAYSNAHFSTALLWGTLSLALTLSRRVADFHEKFVDILLELGRHLPRMQRLVNTFSNHERLRDVLAAIYSEIIQLFILALEFFGKKGLRFVIRILWSDFETQTTRAITRIDRHRQLIDLEANSYHLSESKSARAGQHTHQDFLESLEVIKWLAPVEVDSYLERIQANHESGTSNWFHDSIEVKSWLTSNSSLLWVNGIPGSGKSVLCSELVSRLIQTPHCQTPLYFFCDAGDSTRRSAIGVLRSLLAQLVSGKTDLIHLVRDEIIRSGEQSTMSFKRLASLLELLSNHLTTSYSVIIDAWDECEDARNSSLLDLLEKLANKGQLRLAVFSRCEPWIQQHLASWPEIQITPDKIQDDIELVVERATKRAPFSKLRDASIITQITETLVSKADGQFLWLRLMIEELERATYLSDIRKILENVPLGLGQLYARTLNRLLQKPEYRRKTAHLLLIWLACSERNLTVQELSTALAVRIGSNAIDPEDQVIDLRGFVEDTCGSLVRFSSSTTDDANTTLQLVHLTVKTFLLESQELWASKTTGISRFRVDKADANRHIASVCITYLNMDMFHVTQSPPRGVDLITDTVTEARCFLDYAAFNWVRHLGQSGPPTMDLLRQLQVFLSSDSLLAYLERHVSENNATFSISNLLVSQRTLNDWIQQCNSQDPRITVVMDCFHTRLEQSVLSRSEKLGFDHVETLEAKYQLAQLYHYRCDWERSVTLHREVLADRLRTIGEADPSTLGSMYQLAMVTRRRGELNESFLYHERCLKLRREHLGRDHPDTLLSEDGLAKTMNEQGRREEAEALARSTLVRKVRTRGEDSLEAIRTMDNLAAILKDIGVHWFSEGNSLMANQYWWECESLSQKCLSVRESCLGPENPETITCVNMLAIVLAKLDRLEESEVLHRRALQTRLKVFGLYNPQTQRSMRNLGDVLRKLGKTAEADNLRERYQKSTAVDRQLVDREQSVVIP